MICFCGFPTVQYLRAVDLWHECVVGCSELGKVIFQFIQCSNYKIYFCFFLMLLTNIEKAFTLEKIVVRRLQVLKYTDKSLVSHMLVKSKMNILVVMWGPNFTFFFFCLFQICSFNLIGLLKFVLCHYSNVYVDDVVMPNWLNNPLLWDDPNMGFTCACGDLDGESFNLKYLPSSMRETTLIVGIWKSWNQLLGQLPECSCSGISCVFLDALRMQLG